MKPSVLFLLPVLFILQNTQAAPIILNFEGIVTNVSSSDKSPDPNLPTEIFEGAHLHYQVLVNEDLPGYRTSLDGETQFSIPKRGFDCEGICKSSTHPSIYATILDGVLGTDYVTPPYLSRSLAGYVYPLTTTHYERIGRTQTQIGEPIEHWSEFTFEMKGSSAVLQPVSLTNQWETGSEFIFWNYWYGDKYTQIVRTGEQVIYPQTAFFADLVLTSISPVPLPGGQILLLSAILALTLIRKNRKLRRCRCFNCT